MTRLIENSEVPDFTGLGSGKAFEKVTLERLIKEEELGNGSFGRYGTQASFFRKEGSDEIGTHASQSLPDFEGVVWNGRHATWDCKVVSGSSLNLSKYRIELRGSKARQLEHLFKRSMFRTLCGFLIHFNSRATKTIDEPAETYWLPVHPQMRLWRSFDKGEITNITRAHCRVDGIEVKWTKFDRERKYRPDVIGLLLELAGIERR